MGTGQSVSIGSTINNLLVCLTTAEIKWWHLGILELRQAAGDTEPHVLLDLVLHGLWAACWVAYSTVRKTWDEKDWGWQAALLCGWG